VITTVAQIADFLMLVLSGCKMNPNTELMIAITITLALVMGILFLPCLLMRLDAGGLKVYPLKYRGTPRHKQAEL
jgi:hypothetical protein